MEAHSVRFFPAPATPLEKRPHGRLMHVRSHHVAGWKEEPARALLSKCFFTGKSLRPNAGAGIRSGAWTAVPVSSSGGCETFWSTVRFFSSLPWDGACPDLILEWSQEHSCGKDPYLRAEKHCVIDITWLIKIWSEPS